MSKGLLAKAGSYVISSGLNSAVPFLLMPVFTRYLTPSDMGVVAMYQSTLNIFAIIIELSLPSAVSVRYFNREGIDLPVYTGTGWILVAASTVLCSLFALLVAPWLEEYIDLPLHWVLIAIFSAMWAVGIQLRLRVWQMEGRVGNYALLQNGYTLAIMAVSILLVVVMAFGWEGRAMGQFLSTAGLGIGICLFLLKRGDVKIRWNATYAREILAFGLPLIPHGLGAVAIVFAGRVVLNTMAGLHDVGLYTVASQLTFIIALIATAFNQAYAPWLFRRLSEGDACPRRRIVMATYAYFVIAALGAAVFSWVGAWAIDFYLGPGYSDAFRFVPWLAYSAAFTGMYYMVTNYLFHNRKTGRLAALTLIVGGLSIPLSMLLIKLNGAVGAAQAVCAANFVMFICTWVMAARVEPMPWNLFRK